MQQSKFVSHDGREIALYTWSEVKTPKAVVLIVHGMAEHAKRYDEFATFLNQNDFLAVSTDNRGHGQTAQANSLGFEEGDMFQKDVDDKILLIKSLKEKYQLPLVLFGHSYGSFLTQAVMENGSAADFFVLSGSNLSKGMMFSACGAIANHLCKHKGARHPAEILVKLSFTSYEKKIPGKSNWLSRDPESVKKYLDDQLCGFTCSANFYRSFMKGLKRIYKKENYTSTDINKPILLVAGTNDPVGNYGKGIKKLADFYQKKVGAVDVSTLLYDGGRHEMLNEINKIDVFADILNWLNQKISPDTAQ